MKSITVKKLKEILADLDENKEIYATDMEGNRIKVHLCVDIPILKKHSLGVLFG